MSDPERFVREIFSNPTAILGFALVLLALFAGLLVYDYVRRRKHRRHSRRFRTPRLSLWARVRLPFEQMGAVWKALKRLAQKRARRQARAERAAEQMRRYSK